MRHDGGQAPAGLHRGPIGETLPGAELALDPLRSPYPAGIFDHDVDGADKVARGDGLTALGG